jgi:hypothetical protein
METRGTVTLTIPDSYDSTSKEIDMPTHPKNSKLLVKKVLVKVKDLEQIFQRVTTQMTWQQAQPIVAIIHPYLALPQAKP